MAALALELVGYPLAAWTGNFFTQLQPNHPRRGHPISSSWVRYVLLSCPQGWDHVEYMSCQGSPYRSGAPPREGISALWAAVSIGQCLGDFSVMADCPTLIIELMIKGLSRSACQLPMVWTARCCVPPLTKALQSLQPCSTN